MREPDVLKAVPNIRRVELRRWIEQGWVMPERRDGDYWFREIDVARVQLVVQIRKDMAVAEDGVPTVLSLLDQVYGLRNELRRVGQAIEAQPNAVRKAIAEHVRQNS